MGSQRPCEGFRAQITSRAKFNKDVKIRKADFFLNISPDGEIYHIREADISRCEATYHSRKARISLERSANITRAKREYHSSEARISLAQSANISRAKRAAPFGREVTERNTFALAKVLTPSKIPKQSFVILKRSSEG